MKRIAILFLLAFLPGLGVACALGETASGWSYVIAGGEMGYMDSSLLSVSAEPDRTAQPAQQTSQTEIVGMTADWDYIHRYTAENGAEIYFTSVERTPRIKQEDVNMDGVLDLVVMVNAGASNAMYEFFLCDSETYRYVKHGGISYGLANYVLKDGYVVSDATNGHAGALFEICIFRWVGDELELVRRAESDLVRERTYAQTWYTETTFQDRLLMTIRDYQSGEYEGTVIWEKEIADQDVEAALFEEIDRALWQGLK